MQVRGHLETIVNKTGDLDRQRPRFGRPATPVECTPNVGLWQELPLEMYDANVGNVPLFAIPRRSSRRRMNMNGCLKLGSAQAAFNVALWVLSDLSSLCQLKSIFHVQPE